MMNDRSYVRVFGDMAAYLGMFSNDGDQLNGELEEIIDGAKLHCLYFIQDFPDGCQANCAFCVQGTHSKNTSKESYLINNSLVKYPLKKVVKLIEDGF